MKMTSRIMDLNLLQVGSFYKLVSNAGYFRRVCQYIGVRYGFATFIDEDGRQHTVHPTFLHDTDNPIGIYNV